MLLYFNVCCCSFFLSEFYGTLLFQKHDNKVFNLYYILLIVIFVDDACFRETEDVLDDEDYELLRDNNAFHHRPKVVRFLWPVVI